MMGLFGRERTARLFYTSDQEVVYDIILRRLADYAAGDHVSLPRFCDWLDRIEWWNWNTV